MKHLQQFIILMIVMALTVTSSPLLGQSVGERLRVKTTDGSKLIGTVSSTTSNSFDLNLDSGGRKSVKLGEIKKLEKSIGMQTNAKKGFIIGTAAGSALLGVSLGVLASSTCDVAEGLASAVDEEADCGGFGVGAFAMGAVVGAVLPGMFPFGLIGSAIGKAKKTEKWQHIPSPRTSSHFQISPVLNLASIRGDRRALLGARIHF